METADGYHGTIATSGRHRIVRCNDNLQWIVQRRKAHGGDRSWRAIAYVCNESWLCVVLERPSLGIPPEDTAVILAQWEARGPGNRK